MNNDVTPTETQDLSHLSNLSKTGLRSGTMRSDPNRHGCLGSDSITLEARLEIWIVARCHEKEPEPQRVAELNAIFYLIYTDRRFWRYRNEGNRDYYEDALLLMWRYFALNLCKATTARKRGSFLETRTYAVGRLLMNLDGHLKNIQKQKQKQLYRQETVRSNDDEDCTDLVDEVPNPEPNLAVLQFDAFLQLLEEDPKGELNAKENTLRGQTKNTKETYELTAQTYLLKHYRDKQTIQQIADERDIPRGSLQGGLKPTRWKVLARKYAQMAMDLVSE